MGRRASPERGGFEGALFRQLDRLDDGGPFGKILAHERAERLELAHAAFALFATRMEDLVAVADAGEIMPPKSTWFEPKLADGIVSNPLWE